MSCFHITEHANFKQIPTKRCCRAIHTTCMYVYDLALGTHKLKQRVNREIERAKYGHTYPWKSYYCNSAKYCPILSLTSSGGRVGITLDYRQGKGEFKYVWLARIYTVYTDATCQHIHMYISMHMHVWTFMYMYMYMQVIHSA